MAKTIDTVKGAFSDALKMWERRGKEFFVDLAKVSILEWAVFIVPMVILVSLALIMLGSTSLLDEDVAVTTLLGNIAFMVIAVILILIAYFVSIVFASVRFNIVDNRMKGKDTGIINQFKANFVPYSLYTILVGLIGIVLLLPVLLGFLLSGPSDDSGYIFRILGNMCLFGFISVILYMFFAFFIQFSKFELIIERAGIVESLKRSYRLVRKNLVTVFIFDIVYIIIALVVGSVSSVIQRIFLTGAQFLMMFGSVVGAALAALLYILVAFLISIISTFILLPIFYSFWRRLKAPKEKTKKK
jgi:hypothetical protein